MDRGNHLVEQRRVWQEIADTPSTAVVYRLMERTGRNHKELPPLADSIDPDALNKLVSRTDGVTSLSFTHAGYEIEFSNATLAVRPLDDYSTN